MDFEIYSEVVKNSDIIITRKETPKKIGVSYKKKYQRKLVSNYMENISYKDEKYEVIELSRPIMGFSLEKEIVDTIVIDAVKGFLLDGEKISTASKEDYTTYVMLVKKDFKQTSEFKRFVKSYNESIRDLKSDELLFKELGDYMDIDFDGRKKKLWNKLNIMIVPIEEQKK